MTTVLIFVGPSAIGKSFAANALTGSYPEHFARVKVYTTRQRRESEEASSDRIFASEKEFKQMTSDGEFSLVEYFADNWYGIRKKEAL